MMRRILSFLRSFSWNTFWVGLTARLTVLTAISTVAIAITAWIQLTDINKTARAEFVHKLKTDFFTKETRSLLTLIENKSLFFKTLPNTAIFKVKIPETLKTYLKNSIDTNREYYTTQEIDDFLLGPLEDAGLLLKNDIIKKEDADQQFEYYFKTVIENKEIKKYLAWAKKQAADDDIYSNIKYLKEQLNKFEKKKQHPN